MGNQIIQVEHDESFKLEEFNLKIGHEPLRFSNKYLQNLKVFDEYLKKNVKVFKENLQDLKDRSEGSHESDCTSNQPKTTETNKNYMNLLSFTNPKFKINISKELKSREEIKVMLLEEMEK